MIKKKSSEILENFHDLLGEYTIRNDLVNAKRFWVPQNRERVFVISSRLKM
jgi:site-specific DNA-cytosine methylase